MFKIIRRSTLVNNLRKEYNSGYFDGQQQTRLDEMRRRQEFAAIKAEELLGRFIIGITNEHCNPYIGKVDRFTLDSADGVIPIFHCLIHDQECYFMGAYKIFTPQVFEATMRLEVDHRAALFFNHLYDGREVEFNMTCGEPILSPRQIETLLIEKGFDFTKMDPM